MYNSISNIFVDKLQFALSYRCMLEIPTSYTLVVPEILPPAVGIYQNYTNDEMTQNNPVQISHKNITCSTL